MKKNNIYLGKITKEQADDIACKVLNEYFTEQAIRFGNIYADLEISRGVFFNNKLVGVYLFSRKQDPDQKLHGVGIEGICLAVLKRYRNKGLGKMLINYSESLPFDYIHGGHDKRLNNINYWLKRRTLYSESDSSFHTYKYLSNINKFASK